MKKLVCCLMHVISFLSGASIHGSAPCSSNTSDYFKKNLKVQPRAACSICKKDSLVLPCLDCAKQYTVKSVFRIEADSDGKPELVSYFQPGITGVCVDKEGARDVEYDALYEVDESHLRDWAEKYLTSKNEACDLSKLSYSYPDRERYIRLMRSKNEEKVKRENKQKKNDEEIEQMQKEYAQSETGKAHLARAEKSEQQRYEIHYEEDSSTAADLEQEKQLAQAAVKDLKHHFRKMEKLDKVLKLKIKLERRAAIAKWKKAIEQMGGAAPALSIEVDNLVQAPAPTRSSSDRRRTAPIPASNAAGNLLRVPQTARAHGVGGRLQLAVNPSSIAFTTASAPANPYAGLTINPQLNNGTQSMHHSPSLGSQMTPAAGGAVYVPSPTKIESPAGNYAAGSAQASPSANPGQRPSAESPSPLSLGNGKAVDGGPAFRYIAPKHTIGQQIPTTGNNTGNNGQSAGGACEGCNCCVIA